MIFLLWVILAGGLCGECMGLSRAAARFRRPALLFCTDGPEDDSDIRIAGQEPPRSEDDPMPEIRELERHRENGNIDKARALGEELARRIINEDGDPAFGRDPSESDAIRRQRRMLLAFVVDAAVRQDISSQVLGQVVLHQFTERVKSSLPAFYEDVSSSGSFSFYYLCLRRDSDDAPTVEDAIGRTFAMLTEKENSPVFEELGKALYLHFHDIVDRCVHSCRFAR